jgi:hypothetical protein
MDWLPEVNNLARFQAGPGQLQDRGVMQNFKSRRV